MLWCQGVQNITLDYNLYSRSNVHRMITMHARFRRTDRRTNIVAIASRAKNCDLANDVDNLCQCRTHADGVIADS